MKKSFAIICALLSLAACNKVTPIEENPTQKESGQEFKVNLTFSRSNISEDTKASVKTSFASGDVVFIFFNGVGDSTNPKYLEMKYNGSTWVPTQKNDLGASDLSGAGTKKLTAIYLPYGSGYEVAYDGGFTIKDDSGNDYSGHFFSGHVEYEFTDNTLSATISLSAVPSDTAGDKLVHFDVSGFASDHTYAMYQEYMKPISLTKIAANGDVSKQVGTMGDAITGYQDASVMSFSGVLDESVVGSSVNYNFSITDDARNNYYYTRNAGLKTVAKNMYIGLGDISNISIWPTCVDLGLSVMWGTFNLGASSETEKGKYYAWGETTGYYWEDPQFAGDHSFAIATYSLANGDWETIKKYNNDSDYGTVDNKTLLELGDDAANVELGELWRIPTKEEWGELVASCSWTWQDNYNGSGVKGYLGTSKTNSQIIFLPAAGVGVAKNMQEVSNGMYWSSSLSVSDARYAGNLNFSNGNIDPEIPYTSRRNRGLSIRPIHYVAVETGSNQGVNWGGSY